MAAMERTGAVPGRAGRRVVTGAITTAAALGIGAFLAACSADEPRACLSDGGQDPGRACVVRSSGGAVEVEAEGLLPDTTVVISTERTGATELTIGADGQTSGQLAFLSALRTDEPLQIEIRRPDGMGSNGTFDLPAR